MKPASRRRGALALLALAGCGVAQNMGQWVGGEHCAGSHCGPSKSEPEEPSKEAQRLAREALAGGGSGWFEYDILDGNRFDGLGVVQYLGSGVKVDFSADAANYYSRSTGHRTGDRENAARMTLAAEGDFSGDHATQWSLGAPGAWFSIRLVDHALRPTYYVYRGDMGGGGNHPRTWTLEASADGQNWTPLREHDDDDGSVTNTQAGGWPLEAEEHFSYFRIRNRGHPNHLCCSGVDFYGELVHRKGAGAVPVTSFAEEPGAASGGLREALDGAPRLKLVAAGSDDALHFDNAATLRAGGEAPLTANGKNVGLYWSQPRNAWGHWDYIDLGVSEKLRPLRVKLDGPYIVWEGGQGEFAFDVSMWQLHEGRHLVLVQACEGNPGGPTRMSQDAAGRDFVLYADGTIGPRTATHLRLGVVSKIGNLRPGWSAHEDIDMAYQGDVEIIHNWREEHSIEDLQRIVERKGYSAISVGSFDHAALKKFPYQLTAGHCEPSPGYSNTFYIWGGRGGGGGSADGSEVAPKEPGEGSGGSLRKVEVGRVMSWYDYRARAKQEGGRLPTTAELRAAGVDVGYDQWTPITPSPGDQETGRRDGARGKDENAWANIGPRKYQIEYPAWGLDASEHPWKRLTYFYVVSDFGKDWDGFEDDESGALGIISSVQPKIIDSRLVLVRRGSPNVLRFDHWQALQAGSAAPLTVDASHPGNGIGTMYPEERRFQEWRYTESKCVAERDACSVQLVQGKFLKRVDANLVLDVAFWKFHEGTAVNWVGGGSDDRTYLHGGGRDFRVNSDGSICLVNHPRLCLGVIDPESRVRLFRWRRWLSKVQGVCSNDWPEFPGDYPYEAFANSGKCRGGDFDEDVGTVADIGECWSRCQDLNEPGKTSYCASMHQTSMECSCQGADPDGDFDELECLEDVGEYTLAVHEGWRGSRCYGNDGRVCACDGGDYCLPCDYCLPWTREHMAGPFKEGLLSYAFLAIGFSLLLGPGVWLIVRVGLCWVAIPGLMAAAPPGTGVVAFLWILVGIIVYRCIETAAAAATAAATETAAATDTRADAVAEVDKANENCQTPLYIACQNGHVDTARLLLDNGAEVDKANENGVTPLYIACEKGHIDVARLLLEKGANVDKAKKDGAIEANESTTQVMQNPPPPRHDLLNMYSGEIGICVLLFYFFGLYQHAL
ncbi:unnamed protein product [Pelagomonas calceolata]|uniref:F5/8 type C domain-containing protein n=1 Tax=Pelagomonas calceolata TaxID=35677 RepID=A0A8J2X7F4_9STRA|nr:unnamed protein product [Pelagomonas calceolata]